MDIELDTVTRGHIITLSLTARLGCHNEILGNIWRLETVAKQNGVFEDIVKPVISMIYPVDIRRGDGGGLRHSQRARVRHCGQARA